MHYQIFVYDTYKHAFFSNFLHTHTNSDSFQFLRILKDGSKISDIPT